MSTVALFCLAIAVILFAFAAFNVSSLVNLTAAGLFFLALGMLMPHMRTLVTTLAAITLTGCAVSGISKFTPAQLKELGGLAACNSYQGMYGKAKEVIVGDPNNIQAKASGTFKVTLGDECVTIIEGTVTRVVPPTVAASAPGAK